MKVLVLGASRGIGLEFVRQYMADGAQVIATARDDEGLQRLKGPGAKALQWTLAQPASISGLAWLLDGEEIDIALYVAGVFPQGGALAPPTREVFDNAMHTNVLGAMQAIPQVAPLVEAARNAKAVSLSSAARMRIDGVENSRGWAYRASKAALNMVVALPSTTSPGEAILAASRPAGCKPTWRGAAPLTTAQSVTAMRTALAGLTPEHKGAFLDYDGSRFGSW